jgi:RNA polymerase sigma factor (sigma-70 family)
LSPVSIPEHFFRHEYGRLVAVLSRRVGVKHIEAIQDAVQSALAVALETWKMAPLPENPSAWLYRVAANHLIGDLRQHSRRLNILKRYSRTDFQASSVLPEVVTSDEIADDLLRMLFFCCDPGMPLEAQLVLALKTLCGFNVREIALRLFTSEENVYKRLGRARNHLRKKPRGAYEMSPREYPTRLPAVHHVLYLLFTEGYLSTHVDYSVRNDLCQEAIRLTELLVHSPACATPETAALLALMHFHSSRTSARVDGSGGLILLEDQDRSLWDRKHIETGLRWLELSAQGNNYSRYHAEAAISAEHCLAPSFSETRWDQIVHHYDLLISIVPSANLQLNRAIAIAEAKGPAEGLAVLEHMLPPTWLATSYLWAAVLADLHFRNGSPGLADQYVAKALQAAPTPAIRELLRRRFEPHRTGTSERT